MEWYLVLALAVVFMGIVALLAHLHKSGVLTKQEFRVLDSVIEVVDSLLAQVNKKENSIFYDTARLIIELVDKAVHAVENDWYNNKISKEDRYDACMVEFEKMLTAFEIELTAEQWGIIDALIRAACEEMGHTEEAEKPVETVE